MIFFTFSFIYKTNLRYSNGVIAPL